MSPGRWFATGPDIEVAPSAAGEEGRAILAAAGRARFYGAGVLWRIEDGRAVAVRRYVSEGGVLVERDP